MARRDDSMPGSGNRVPPCDQPDDGRQYCRLYEHCRQRVQTCTAFRQYVRRNQYGLADRGEHMLPAQRLAEQPDADADEEG